MTFEIRGNLSTTESVRFRYAQQDIMCLEMLQLQDFTKTAEFDLLQEFDLKEPIL